jgi:hypothetical protein
MRIPILMLVNSTDSIRDVALGVSTEAPTGIPESVELDTDFTPVPVNVQDGDKPTADVVATESASTYIVRGFIDADPTDPPTQVEGVDVYADPQIDSFLTCINTPAVGTSDDVARLLDVTTLAQRGLDGSKVAVGIVDTGINLAYLTTRLGWTPALDAANSWTPKGSSTTPGNWPIAHATMCAFDVLIAAPKATLIDIPVLRSGGGGGSAMSGYLSAAVLAFSSILVSWSVAGTGNGLDQYSALVLSNSWGIFNPVMDFPSGHPGRYCDNPKHPFNMMLEPMARAGIDVVFAAGNCGADCPDGRCKGRTTEAIMGASASVDAFSVAGCDINGARVGYSSQGPSIAGMYGQKPDITGYTHFLGSKFAGGSTPDSGTSAACPVVAGCIAAIRTKADPRSPVSPYMLYDHFRTNATTPAGQSSGWNADCGYGIVNVVAVADQLSL